MSPKIELPKAHIKDLLKNDHDVMIGADSIDKCNEMLSILKEKLNQKITVVMNKQGRKTINEPQLVEAFKSMGFESKIYSTEKLKDPRLNKSDMRRILEDEGSDFKIGSDAIEKLQSVLESLLRIVADKCFIYLNIMDRKTINDEAVNLSFQSILPKEDSDISYSNFLENILYSKELEIVCEKNDLPKSGTKIECAKLISSKNIPFPQILTILENELDFIELQTRLVKGNFSIFENKEEFITSIEKIFPVKPSFNSHNQISEKDTLIEEIKEKNSPVSTHEEEEKEEEEEVGRKRIIDKQNQSPVKNKQRFSSLDNFTNSNTKKIHSSKKTKSNEDHEKKENRIIPEETKKELSIYSKDIKESNNAVTVEKEEREKNGPSELQDKIEIKKESSQTPFAREQLNIQKPQENHIPKSPEYNVGQIVFSRDRLWRIDQIHVDKNDLKNHHYSVTSITGVPTSEVLFPKLESVYKSSIPEPSPDMLGSPIYQKLLLKAIRLDLIYGTTSFISLQNSKVIPISYQLVPVLMALNLQQVRLLLADDVGLGKTVETGLILQELLGRKKITRVLFITPANLREQWQTIMRNFFGIEAVIMSSRNRRFLESELLVGGSPWGYYNFVITSIDYAKRTGVKEEIMQFNWDMVIIDEAHNVMLPHLGTDDESSDNIKQSYLFTRKISEKSPNFLLLTATPHNGYKDSFASLLNFVNPKIAVEEDGEITINKELALNHVCQRRRKDVEKWIGKSYGKSPFPERDSDEIFIQPSNQFNTTIQKLNEFSAYVLDYANDFTDEKNKINYWTILHFHKRAISSPHAMICSIDNRIEEIDKKLNKKYQAIEKIENFLSLQEAGQVVFDGVETDRLSEEERDVRSDKVILNKSMEILAKEKKLLEKAKNEAIKLRGLENDTKLRRLVEEIIPNRFKDSKKIIIFTRYIDTLRYIVKNLEEKVQGGSLRYKGVEIFAVHGQLASQKRMDIYNNFLKHKNAILISTDCMAEGIDLQFSSNQIINYELTWNPNRLEQRNGRVDRFGQPEDKVYIRTLIMDDTLEVDILELLVKKAEKIKEDYGFVPGFFGDPKDVIDRIADRKRKKKKEQGTLDLWLKMAPKIMDELVSIFYNKENVEEIMKDSFYGHNNINLEEIEKRMKLTQEKIGDSATLFEFLTSAVNLYQGEMKLAPESKENLEIYQLSLPEEVQHDLNMNIHDKYKVTQNMKVATVKKDVDGVSLKNPLIAGLIEKVKNEAFIEGHRFYGRTAAFASKMVEKVTVIHSVKIRYVINTEPKTLTEEVALVGLDLFSNEKLLDTQVEQIMEGDMKNHSMPEIQVKKHLKKALESKNLEDIFNALAKKNLKVLIEERNELVNSLKAQGMITDLDGINKVDIVGIDHLTTTLVYPGGND